jgi:hypothetical protein
VTLLGGYPLRQLIAASEGNTDCVISILGLITGAAFTYNFGLLSIILFAGLFAFLHDTKEKMPCRANQMRPGQG